MFLCIHTKEPIGSTPLESLDNPGISKGNSFRAVKSNGFELNHVKNHRWNPEVIWEVSEFLGLLRFHATDCVDEWVLKLYSLFKVIYTDAIRLSLLGDIIAVMSGLMEDYFSTCPDYGRAKVSQNRFYLISLLRLLWPEKCIVLQFWRLEVRDQVLARSVPLKACEEDSVPGLASDSGGFLVICAVLWHVDAPNLCLHLHMAFSLCAGVCANFPLF